MATTLTLNRIAPGPRGAFLLGIIPDIRRDSLGFLTHAAHMYGDVVRYHIGPMLSHLIVHPDGLKYVLQDHVKNYTKDHFSYGMTRWVVGNGLLTSQGDFWLRQRRLAQPAFHRQRLVAMAETMINATNDLLARWEDVARQGTRIDAAEEMMRLTLRIAGETLFGTSVEPQTQAISHSFVTLSEQLVTRFRSFNLLPPVLPTNYDRIFRHAKESLSSVVYAIIAERRKRGEDAGDLLSMLMLARDEDTGEQMSDAQLHDEVLTMLLAGHETTATAMTWVCGLLDRYPEARAKLEAEVDTVLAGRTPTVEDLAQMPYGKMVLEETMRLYPPAYIFSRQVIEDDEIGGFRIPAKSWVDISPYVTHRHPGLWDEPEQFRPERFAADQAQGRSRFAYFPFSGGPRQCIGNNFAMMEAQIILAMMVQRFRLHIADGHPLVPEPLVTLRVKGGLPMKVSARS